MNSDIEQPGVLLPDPRVTLSDFTIEVTAPPTA